MMVCSSCYELCEDMVGDVCEECYEWFLARENRVEHINTEEENIKEFGF